MTAAAWGALHSRGSLLGFFGGEQTLHLREDTTQQDACIERCGESSVPSSKHKDTPSNAMPRRQPA